MEEIFKKAWEYFKEHWKFLCIVSAIGIMVPMLLIMIPMMGAYAALAASSATDSDPLSMMSAAFSSFGIFGFIGMIVMMLTQAGLINSSLIITNGGTPGTKSLFLDGGTYVKGFLALLLSGIMMCISSVFCIVPGIILAFFLALVPYEIMSNPNVGVIDAIKNSFNLVKSDWKTALVVLLLCGIGVSILANTFIGIIPAYPFSYLATAVLYRQLKGQETAAAPAAPQGVLP